jgi:hypothetical protein
MTRRRRTEYHYDEVDTEALERSLALTLREPDRRAQIVEVCLFAASHCQTKALKLKLWEIAPCALLPSDDPGDHGVAAARELRDRLLAAGLSRFEPDPMAALERHAAKAKTLES